MRRVSNIFYRFAALLTVLAVVLSCISDKSETEPHEMKMASVLMKLNISSDNHQVKSTIEPTDAEKVINSLRIYAFTAGKNGSPNIHLAYSWWPCP